MNSDLLQFLALARRRYPDAPLEIAALFFGSDRRRAGLGALDERKRKLGEAVSNYKRDVLERGGVVYHMKRHTRARQEYTLPSADDLNLSTSVEATQTVQVVTIPAINQHLCVDVLHRDLRDHGGRRKVARLLREARRQLRQLI